MLTLQRRLEEALRLADSSTELMRIVASTPDLAGEQGLSLQFLARRGRGDEARERIVLLEQECAASGDLRATLQVQTNALLLDVTLGDAVSAGIRVLSIDERSALSKPHPQTTAVLETV